MRYLPPAVKNLLIINIIVFFGTELIGDPIPGARMNEYRARIDKILP